MLVAKKSRNTGKSKKSDKSSKVQKRPKPQYSSMTVDDFLQTTAEQDDGSDASNDNFNNKQPKIARKTHSEPSTDSESDELDDSSHARSLNQLKNTDPEFYNFLQENDRSLLDFDLYDNDQEKDDGNDENSDGEDNVHEPNAELEAASDESDFEDVDVPPSDRVITLRMIKQWQQELAQPKVSISILGNLMKAFNAALHCVANDDSSKSFYIIDGSAVFNAVIQLCVLHLSPAVTKFLKLSGSAQKPHKCKRWIKIKSLLKGYFTDLLKLLGGVTSSNILTILLKHLHQMHSFLCSFPNTSRQILKKLISIWSTSDETVRVLAFICILRITRHQQVSVLDMVLKAMYMMYVKNCKFVSPTALPSINFMRRSLTEMFALDLNVSYPHVFLYIRQLAIHLRNAITLHKKENIQTVYNWQYISSLHLWADLLSLTNNKPQLQSLVYPLVMITINTIKLIPTSQYFPLRFHCLQILINLSKNSGLYIPTLPLIMEVLKTFDFNQKHKKASLKPMQFTCILRVSKSQMAEHGFKDAVFENVYKLLLEALANEAHSIAFPDLIVPFVVQIKIFLKKCHVASYCKKLRHLLDKVNDNAKFIENNRNKLILDLNNTQIINSWEIDIKSKGLPLEKYYKEWLKVNDIQKKKKITNTEEIADFAIPSIKRSSKRVAPSGPVELFPSDSEDEEIINYSEDESKMQKLPQKRRKRQTTEELTEPDIFKQSSIPDTIENLDISKW